MDPLQEPAEAIQRHRYGYERILLGTLVAGFVLCAAGFGAIGVPQFLPVSAGATVTAIGILLLITAIELAHPLPVLRTIGLKATGGRQYDRLQRWRRIKATSITLHLLTLLNALVILCALTQRMGLIDLSGLPLSFVYASLAAYGVLFTVTLAVAFRDGLRTALERSLSQVGHSFFHLFAAGALLLAITAAAAAHVRFALPGIGTVRSGDTPLLLLAALGLGAIAVFLSRGLPTIQAWFIDELDAFNRSQSSAQRSLVLPTMLAFAMLFLVFLLALVVELGLVRLVEEIPRNAMLIGTLLFIGVTAGVAMWSYFIVPRTERDPALIRQSWRERIQGETVLLAASGVLAGLLAAAALWLYTGHGFLGLGRGRWVDLLSLALLVGLGPAGFTFAKRLKRVRQLEERFPDFLRDLAAGRRAGLTLPSAVTMTARGDYGQLTAEVRKMADQLALNVPFEEALGRFGRRVQTPLVLRAVDLVNEASHAGGQFTDVLEAAAQDAFEIKSLENERRTTMFLYSVIIYIIFGVFLFVCAVLYSMFLPEYIKAASAAVELGANQVGGIVLGTVPAESYRVFYFLASLVQAVGNGLIAGLIESGRAMAGLRHCFFMVAVTYVTFGFLL